LGRKITGGEVIKRFLVNEGVKYVFGVPGDQLYPLLDAFYNDDKIKFITFHHEAAAAHAADGYARVTGKPGVVIATVGPGAANLVGGVYPAYAEGIPIISTEPVVEVLPGSRLYASLGSNQFI